MIDITTSAGTCAGSHGPSNEQLMRAVVADDRPVMLFTPPEGGPPAAADIVFNKPTTIAAPAIKKETILIVGNPLEIERTVASYLTKSKLTI